MRRLTQASSREKSVVNEIFGGYLRSQGMSRSLVWYDCLLYIFCPSFTAVTDVMKDVAYKKPCCVAAGIAVA